MENKRVLNRTKNEFVTKPNSATYCFKQQSKKKMSALRKEKLEYLRECAYNKEIKNA